MVITGGVCRYSSSPFLLAHEKVVLSTSSDVGVAMWLAMVSEIWSEVPGKY